jgi:hypothetical protein
VLTKLLKMRKPERGVDIRNVPYSRANLPGNGNAWSREDSNSVSRGASFTAGASFAARHLLLTMTNS